MKKAQTSMESILLVAGAIFFVAIVAMSTRSLIVGGGDSVDDKGVAVASAKAIDFGGTPIPLEVSVFKPSVSPPPPATATPTPVPPTITNLECKVGGVWGACDNARAPYAISLQGVRAQCTDPEGLDVDVSFNLKNIADIREDFLGEEQFETVYLSGIINDPVGGYFELLGSVQLMDSNIYRLTTTCTDVTSQTATNTLEWTLPYGTLSAIHFEPAAGYALKTGQSFNFSEILTCNGGECFDINAYLDPIFGNPSTYGLGLYDSLPDSNTLAARFQMNSSLGMLTKITARVYNIGNKKFYAAIYADASGSPGAKIADAKEFSDTTGQIPDDQGITQKVFNFSNELLQPNQFYWLALAIDGLVSGGRLHYNLSSNTPWALKTGLPSASSSFGTPTFTGTSNKYQLFATIKNAKTIVPFGKGFPFYTTTPNPITCPGMKGGGLCVVNWTVVANDSVETWDFFVMYESQPGLVLNINGSHVPISIRAEPYCALDRKVVSLCICGLFEQSTGYCCSNGNATLGCTLNFPIRNKADDVTYNTSNGTMISTNGALNTTVIIGNQNNNRYSTALLFTNVTIPNCYAIVNATLRLRSASNPNWNSLKLNITAERTANASMFFYSENFLLRPRTLNAVQWNITSGGINALYVSPNIAPILTELISSQGFVEGNSILMIVEDNLSPGGAGINNYREIQAYEGVAGPYQINLTVFIQ